MIKQCKNQQLKLGSETPQQRETSKLPQKKTHTANKKKRKKSNKYGHTVPVSKRVSISKAELNI